MVPIHKEKITPNTFERLEMLWEKYPQFHEKVLFTSLDGLLAEHDSYAEGFDEVRQEYLDNGYDRFLIQLGWSDLPYRMATKELIESSEPMLRNRYVDDFMAQFRDLNTDDKAYFLFPESFVSQYFVILEVCKNAESLYPIKNLFPDESKVHYLAVFDKDNMDDVLLMFHLLYTNASQEVFGGYSLYDYSFPWYQTHLWQDGNVFRSPFLPDRTAKYLGNLPFYHNPVKTVYVRRNVEYIIQSGYFSSELDFFLSLTTQIMPVFQWWYEDLLMYEEKDGFKTDWRLRRTEIRTKLTAEGIIKPKWKNELSLFHTVRKEYPDTLYQYRPDWLGRQSLDLYIPSNRTAIEYQGIQHYMPVDFFGGNEALSQRIELDLQKKQLCLENHVHLIEWPYSLDPTLKNLRSLMNSESHLEEKP